MYYQLFNIDMSQHCHSHICRGACSWLCYNLMVSGGECRCKMEASVQESKKELVPAWAAWEQHWGQYIYFVIRRKQDKGEGMYV